MTTDGKRRCVDELKACGQSIIDNAEDFVLESGGQTDITIQIEMKGGRTPRITMCTNWYPKSI